MKNIEIKAKCTDLSQARTRAVAIHTGYLSLLHQIDTYFITQKGRLKLRETNNKSAELIPYLKDYQSGPMKSDYAVLAVKDPDAVKSLFHTLLGTEFVVDKKREVFLFENVRIHLDEVAGLGSFIEFEAVCESDAAEEIAVQKNKVAELMKIFEVKPSDLLELSYVDYLCPDSRRADS
jgi:adenylate cyclase class 2